MAPFIMNPFRFAAAGDIGAWKEVGRTTLGSAGDTITVSGLADKRYYMLLANVIPTTGQANGKITFNGDTATNYAGRFAVNGAADGTFTSGSDMYWLGQSDTSGQYFTTANIANLSSKEKLLIGHDVGQNTAGAGSAPARAEIVGKWANTSSSISSIAINNTASSDYSIGSEVVVLGWDPTDTHTTADNFWQELESTTLGAPSSTLDSGTFTAKKYLCIQAYINGVTVDTGLTFNGDISASYARRWSDDGASDGTAVNGNNIQVDRGNSTQFLNMFIVNNSANEKLGMYDTVTQNTAGAANSPQRRNLVFKWANTSSQITSMIFTKQGSGTDLQSGSMLKVWGHD
jgi:hypothetical protein